jgi:hypothetical protein
MGLGPEAESETDAASFDGSPAFDEGIDHEADDEPVASDEDEIP